MNLLVLFFILVWVGPPIGLLMLVIAAVRYWKNRKIPEDLHPTWQHWVAGLGVALVVLPIWAIVWAGGNVGY